MSAVDGRGRWNSMLTVLSVRHHPGLDGRRHLRPALGPGFPTIRPVRAKVSPGPDDNFRGKQTKDCLGLGQQSHGRKDCRALQSSSAHCARRYYNTNMITYKQTRPSACWHGIWPDGLCGFRPNAADMRPVAYGPHWPRLPPCWGVWLAPAVMPGIGLRMWYSASPSMLSPFSYMFACLSLSLCSLDNHFCTVVNSISLFVLDWSQHCSLPSLLHSQL